MDWITKFIKFLKAIFGGSNEPEPVTSSPSTGVVADEPLGLVDAAAGITAVYTGTADGTIASLAKILTITRKQRIMFNVRCDVPDFYMVIKAYDNGLISDHKGFCVGEQHVGKSTAHYIDFPGTNGWTLGDHTLCIVLLDAQKSTKLSEHTVQLHVVMPED